MAKGAVLIHGFGATPWQMQELADCLSDKGITTHNIRLAGHGTSLEDFASTEWQEWCTSAGNAYFNMAHNIDQVYLIGQSLGGALALYIAQHSKPAGIVSINAPIWLKDKRAKFAGLAKYLISSVAAKLTEEEKGHYYERRPLRAVEQLTKFIEAYQRRLHRVESPLLIIQSTEDPTVEPKSAYEIFNKTNSESKTLYLHHSDEHVITRGQHKEEVFPRILEFLKSH